MNEDNNFLLSLDFQAEEQEEEKQNPNKKVHKKKSQKREEKRVFHMQQFKTKEFKQKKRQRKKANLKKRIEGMTAEEKVAFFQKVKQEKYQQKLNQQNGLKNGIPVIIDCCYEQFMGVKEITSLATQIHLAAEMQKQVKFPVSINVTSYQGKIKELMDTDFYKNLPVHKYEQELIEVEKFKDKNFIYLSPDADDDLQEVKDNGNNVYIIGGLVDKVIATRASFYRAQKLNIKSYRLPIKQFLINERKALNIDTITVLLASYLDYKDWEKAVNYALPFKSNKERQQKKLDKQKKRLEFKAKQKAERLQQQMKSSQQQPQGQQQQEDQQDYQLSDLLNL